MNAPEPLSDLPALLRTELELAQQLEETPTKSAAAIAMVTQTMAILRLVLTSALLRIDMNRTRMWGMPKYPKPQARALRICKKP